MTELKPASAMRRARRIKNGQSCVTVPTALLRRLAASATPADRAALVETFGERAASALLEDAA